MQDSNQWSCEKYDNKVQSLIKTKCITASISMSSTNFSFVEDRWSQQGRKCWQCRLKQKFWLSRIQKLWWNYLNIDFLFLAYLYSSSKLFLYGHQISLNPLCYLQPLFIVAPLRFYFSWGGKNTELIIVNCFFMAHLSWTQINLVSPSSITAEEGFGSDIWFIATDCWQLENVLRQAATPSSGAAQQRRIREYVRIQWYTPW